MVRAFTLGISEIAMGACGANGAMGSTLESQGYTNQDSCTLTMEVPEDTEFNAEEEDDPVLISSKAGAITVEYDVMNPSADTLVTLMGGTASKSKDATDNDMWEAPDEVPNIEKSVRITPRQGFIVEIPRGKVTATWGGQQGKTNISLLHVVIKVLKPVGTAAAKRLKLKLKTA